MKSYTDLEQSKKLAKILPLESADMNYFNWDNTTDKPFISNIHENLVDYTPCWSLAALLGVLPEPNLLKKNGWHLFCDNKDHFSSSNGYNNPVDACVAMIIKLYELKKL